MHSYLVGASLRDWSKSQSDNNEYISATSLASVLRDFLGSNNQYQTILTVIILKPGFNDLVSNKTGKNQIAIEALTQGLEEQFSEKAINEAKNFLHGFTGIEPIILNNIPSQITTERSAVPYNTDVDARLADESNSRKIPIESTKNSANHLTPSQENQMTPWLEITPLKRESRKMPHPLTLTFGFLIVLLSVATFVNFLIFINSLPEISPTVTSPNPPHKPSQ